MTTIGVFLGSVRSGRIGEQVGAWVMDAAAERDADYHLLDLADFDVPHLIAEVVPGAANKQYDDPVALNIFGEDVEDGELAPREHKQAALTRALDDLEAELG